MDTMDHGHVTWHFLRASTRIRAQGTADWNVQDFDALHGRTNRVSTTRRSKCRRQDGLIGRMDPVDAQQLS